MRAYADLSRSVFEVVAPAAPYLLVLAVFLLARLFGWLGETYPVRLARRLIARLKGAHFSVQAMLRRGMQQVPCVRVAEAPEGAVVKLVGRVRAVGGPLRSPLKGQACVFFETTVYGEVENEAEGHTHTLWEECARETKAINFWLEDDTGRAFVRAAGWLVVPSVEVPDAGREGLADAPPGVEAFLKRLRLLRPGVPVSSLPLRLGERVFAPGDLVEVVGRVRWELDPEPRGYRSLLKRLVVEVPPDGPLLARHEPDPA